MFLVALFEIGVGGAWMVALEITGADKFAVILAVTLAVTLAVMLAVAWAVTFAVTLTLTA